MCSNVPDEYLDICDCADSNNPTSPPPGHYFDHHTLHADPWSGLYAEAS